MWYRSSIFILRLIANRPKDVKDCVAPAPARMEYEANYSDIEAHYARAPPPRTVEEKVWVTYM
jgi:hypothetical protein